MFKFLTPGFALLKVIPLRYWLAIVLVIVSTVAYAEWLHKDRVAQFKAGQHERQVLWDAQNKTQAEDALQRAISNAQEGKRRTERQEENQHAKDAQLAVARADAVRSDDARARMQQRASKIAAAAGCTGPLIPPLPASARQLPRSQTHSADVEQEFNSWLLTPMMPAPAASSASGTTTLSPPTPAQVPPVPNH
jgi:hypothetical protein